VLCISTKPKAEWKTPKPSVYRD